MEVSRSKSRKTANLADLEPLADTVEVTALFGDSVVSAKHVMNPRGGTITGLTWGLLVTGVVLLATSLFAFRAGVQNAARNQAGIREHVAANHAPDEFRPTRLGSIYDAMALGGGAGGLVLLVIAMVRIREERIEPTYRLGTEAGVDFPTASLGSGALALVAPTQRGFVLAFDAQWRGTVVRSGQRLAFADIASQGLADRRERAPAFWDMPIELGTQVMVHMGKFTFFVRGVEKPRRQSLPLLAAFDSLFVAYLGGATMVVLGLMALFDTHLQEEMTLFGDEFQSVARIDYIRIEPAENPPPGLHVLGVPGPPGATGTRMAEAEGTMGARHSARAAGQYAMRYRDAPPQLAVRQRLEDVRETGILGVLQSSGGDFASITGTADFSSGLDSEDVYGGLLGNEVGEMAGGWGYGIEAQGGGGGGSGWGTIGTGNFGTIGHGSGTGSGYGTGVGVGGTDARGARVPQVLITAATVVGDLDKNIIRRYIRRKLPRIQHCYEKELLTEPNLEGTMETRFQIAPNGAVPAASASGLGNRDVESCVAMAIKSIQFPKPRGGGYVSVRYPFTFKPS